MGGDWVRGRNRLSFLGTYHLPPSPLFPEWPVQPSYSSRHDPLSTSPVTPVPNPSVVVLIKLYTLH